MAAQGRQREIKAAVQCGRTVRVCRRRSGEKSVRLDRYGVRSDSVCSPEAVALSHLKTQRTRQALIASLVPLKAKIRTNYQKLEQLMSNFGTSRHRMLERFIRQNFKII
jgi:hypothetical protein